MDDLETGGGDDSPEPTSGSESSTQDGDDSPETSMSIDEVVGQVRESFGLKDGQRIDQMITGAANTAVRKTFGLEKGQNAMDAIGDRITDAIKASVTPAGDSGGGEDPTVAELRSDLDAVKQTANELAAAKELSDKQAYGEKRKGLIRDALAEWDINANLKGLVTRGFLQGVEADPQVSEDDPESLIVRMADGTDRAFGDYLKSYFDENKSFLAQEKFRGSRDRNADGRPPAPASKEFKKSGRELVSEYADAAKEDPDAALEALRKRNAEKAARLGMPTAQ